MARREDWAAVPAALATVLLSVALAAWVLDAGSTPDLGPGSAAQPALSTGATPRTPPLTPPLRPDQLALPLAGDPQALTLAQRSRDLLVGLAATPGGPVELLTIPGREPVGSLQAWLGRRQLAPRGCGRACYRLDAPVMRGRPLSLRVRVRRVGAPAAEFRFPFPARLPPSGASLFRAADRTMKQLRTLQATETLTSGFAAVRVRYTMRAPDRVRYETSEGGRTVLIGKRRWDFEDGKWVADAFPGTRVPTYFWEGATNARLLGPGRERGVAVQVVSVFNADPFPAWFRLFVARDRRVLSAEMLTLSHFMTDRFIGFNHPVKIEAPS